MSIPSACPACMTGDHDNHDADWNIRPGLIGGAYCDCEGQPGCKARAAEFAGRLLAAMFPPDARDAGMCDSCGNYHAKIHHGCCANFAAERQDAANEIDRLRAALARRVPPSNEQLRELAKRAEANSRSRTWRIIGRLVKTITTLQDAAERVELIPQLCDWLADFKDARRVDHAEFHYGSPCPYASVVPAFLRGEPDPRRLLADQQVEGAP